MNSEKSVVDNLLIKLDEIKEKAESILAVASQGALAKSFENRKNTLEQLQVKWISRFQYGILSLILFTFGSLLVAKHFNIPPIISEGHFDAWGALIRLMLASPILWFTWFSVRQYTNNVTLIEDYAFKEASALAYIGYKKDMSDDEMIKLLQESAIKNFAYAPTRLLNKSDATSPIHEIFEKAFKDTESFNKIIELAKAINPVGKNK